MNCTITEALAEIKTLGKRLEKKRAAVLNYLSRESRMRDPLEKEGGSLEFIKRERQAIADLEDRLVLIRTAIQRANLATKLTCGSHTASVAEWLTWRREVASGVVHFLDSLTAGILAARRNAERQGGRAVPTGTDDKPADIVVNLNEKALAEQHEAVESTLGELDGKLSLLNATTVIEVA